MNFLLAQSNSYFETKRFLKLKVISDLLNISHFAKKEQLCLNLHYYCLDSHNFHYTLAFLIYTKNNARY